MANWNVKIGSRRLIGLPWSHSDHLETPAVYREAAADNFWIGMKMRPPKMFAHDYHVRGIWLIIGFPERPPDKEWTAEHLEKSAGNVKPTDSFRIALAGKSKIIVVIGRQVLKTVLAAAEVQVVRITQGYCVKILKRLDKKHEAIGPWIRKRPQHQAVDETKDRGICTDP
jgi:hypothetical protein